MGGNPPEKELAEKSRAGGASASLRSRLAVRTQQGISPAVESASTPSRSLTPRMESTRRASRRSTTTYASASRSRGPFTDGGDWSDTGIKGVDRFAQRMYRLVKENKKVDQDSAQILGLREKTVRKVSDDIQALRFNTAISALMEFLNGAEKEEGMTVETLQKIVLLLAPLAPHLSEELWEVLGGKGFAIEQAWPAFDASLIKETSITIVVQVNGKLRAELSVSPDIAEANIIAQAKAHPNVQKFLEGKEPKKAIYVKGKLVSLVQ
jgi:leucyl-tRNA synthetase